MGNLVNSDPPINHQFTKSRTHQIIMNVPFELHVALRYLLAKRKQAFISVISFISTLGVTVGVMALVIALALMTGLQTELRDRILGANPHVFVWKPGGLADARADTERLRKVPHVIGAAPAIIGKALVSAAGDEGFINVKGIYPFHVDEAFIACR